MKLKNFLILAALTVSTSGALCADRKSDKVLGKAPDKTADKAPDKEPDKKADKENRNNRFYVEGDVLYWNAHISSLELSAGKGSIVVETEDGITTTFTKELDVDPHFKWRAGYRIGAGYQFDSRAWTLGTAWTHFQDRGTKKVTGASNVNTTKCRVKLDQIDLVLAHNSVSGFCVNFKPFLGIRGAIIRQHLRAFLVTDILYAPSTMATSTRSLHDSQNYHGIGPLLGSQGVVNLGCGFSLYGTAAAALLYGKYKVHFHDSDILTPPTSKSFFSKNRKHLHAFDPNITLALGIRWGVAIYDCFQIGLKLCFEHQQYFNESHLGANRGDLTFDGGVFGLDLLF